MINDSEEARLIETGRMAARLIHDFKNQLSGLKLYAAYLKKRFADNAEGLEIAEKINQGLSEMADQAAILNKLTRPLELRREPGDLAAVIEQVLDSHENGAKGVRIERKYGTDLPALACDWQQLRTALEPILARAIELSPPGGLVTVALRRQEGAVQIAIADQGEALDAPQRAALFDVFVNDRLSKTSLGMAMAQRIIERHGGAIAARANTPAGTIVELRLQIAD